MNCLSLNNISHIKIIAPFLKLCRDFITQEQDSLDKIWKDCKEYLNEEFSLYFDSDSIQIITQNLENKDLLKICAVNKFYGLDEEALKQCEIDFDQIPDLSKFYCNEINFTTDDSREIDEISLKIRENFKEIVWCLYEIIYILPKIIPAKSSKSNSGKSNLNKLNKFKESLVEFEKKKVEFQFELENLKRNKNKKSPIKESIKSILRQASPQVSIEKRKIGKLEARDFVTEKIKQSDIFDLLYFKEVIEEEHKHLIEKMKIHQPILKYIGVDQGKNQPQERYGYSVRRTLAELLQQKYRNSIKTDLTIDFPGYVIELKKLKSEISDPPRKTRDNILIHILNQVKTNMDYKRNNVFIGNPRNPFFQMDCVNYDLYSDDSENNEEITIIEEDDRVNELGVPLTKQFSKGDETAEESKGFEYSNNEEYYKRFDPEKVSKGPTVLTYSNDNENDSEIETSKIRLLCKFSKVKFPSSNPIPRLSEGIMSNLMKVCEMVHGSYATQKNLVNSIVVKCQLTVEEVNPYFHKICMRERRVSDEISRWYVDDKIFEYLKITTDKAKSIAETKNYGESSKVRSMRKSIESASNFKNQIKPRSNLKMDLLLDHFNDKSQIKNNGIVDQNKNLSNQKDIEQLRSPLKNQKTSNSLWSKHANKASSVRSKDFSQFNLPIPFSQSTKTPKRGSISQNPIEPSAELSIESMQNVHSESRILISELGAGAIQPIIMEKESEYYLDENF